MDANPVHDEAPDPIATLQGVLDSLEGIDVDAEIRAMSDEELADVQEAARQLGRLVDDLWAEMYAEAAKRFGWEV